MAQVKKFKREALGHVCAHLERSVEPGHYGNKNIDQARLSEDCVNLAPTREGGQIAYIKQQTNAVMGFRTLRKDAVRMCCWVVTLPVNIPKEKEPIFFQAAYDFLVDRYGSKYGMGEDCVISAYIHQSESTPHLHFAFLPVIKRNGSQTICAKEVVNRADLSTFHRDLAEYMDAKGICPKSDILNGKTKRDDTGRALTVKQLKRGEDDRWTRTRTNDRDRERERGRW